MSDNSEASVPDTMPTFPFEELAYSTYHEIIAAELRNSIRRYNDIWEDTLWKGLQNHKVVAAWVEQYRLPIVVLSCTLLENIINFYLCTKCDAKAFGKLDWKSLFDKWSELPKLFVPTYSLTPILRTDLERLINRRKSIVHPKPFVSIDGDNRHEGNEPKIEVDEHEFVGACARLPFQLVENLMMYDKSFEILFDLRTRCGIIAHEFETGLYRQKTLFNEGLHDLRGWRFVEVCVWLVW
jgi:hypothetical protein